MSIHIVRLGQPRRPGEGLRIGTVRHPPRGLPRGAWATGDWFDVWYPELAPSAELLRATRATTIDAAMPRWNSREIRLNWRKRNSPSSFQSCSCNEELTKLSMLDTVPELRATAQRMTAAIIEINHMHSDTRTASLSIDHGSTWRISRRTLRASKR